MAAFNDRNWKQSLIPEDCTVSCSDGSIRCHSDVLAAGSTYFKDIQTNQNMTLDINLDRTIDLLKFIYIKKVDHAKINLQMMKDAHKFGIHGLKERCSEFLVHQINSDNAVDVLIVADEVSDVKLKESAKTFIVDMNVDLDKLEAYPELGMEVAKACQAKP